VDRTGWLLGWGVGCERDENIERKSESERGEIETRASRERERRERERRAREPTGSEPFMRVLHWLVACCWAHDLFFISWIAVSDSCEDGRGSMSFSKSRMWGVH
jgi:hypothetical protein